jgi:MYXO-CTERM domain-containing protein
MKRILIILLGLALAAPAFAVEPGHTDTFDDGLGGWRAGNSHDGEPRVVPDGGPNGDGDAFMRVDSTGLRGPGSKLVMLNREAWAGDWTGVDAVEADLRNLGDTPLVVRLALRVEMEDTLPPATVELPAGGEWVHARWEVAGLPAGVTEFRILHNADADSRGATVAASIGVDNLIAMGDLPPPPPDAGVPAPDAAMDPPAGGEPAPVGGEPAGGEPAGGEPAGGEPAGGEPAGGEPAPAGGQPAGGEPAPAGGEPAPAGGEPTPVGGEPTPAGGEPAPAGGTASGNGDAGTSSGTPRDDDDGCSAVAGAAPQGSAPWVWALGLLGLGMRRRYNRSRH